MSAFTEIRTLADMQNKEWLSELFKKPVRSFETIDMSGAGGLNASMAKLVITFEDGTVKTAVSKTIPEERWGASKDFGHPRECLFYEKFADTLDVTTPKAYFTNGNMDTGVKLLLLEDLSDCIQSGYFFGNHSPLNWGKDLEALTSPAPGVTMEDIISIVFSEAANIHAKYWNDKELGNLSFLRCSDWQKGTNEVGWAAAHAMSVKAWTEIKSTIDEGKAVLEWDMELVHIIQASLNKISWKEFSARKQSNADAFTLVHGDFHPGNMMYRPSTKEIAIVDWEQVGIGSGAQDLAQYMISHTTPSERKTLEIKHLHTYYKNLCTKHVEYHGKELTGYTLNDCFREFVFGGLERWIWLLVYICNMPSIPKPVAQTFHKAVAQFYHDYSAPTDGFDGDIVINVDTIGMPRV